MSQMSYESWLKQASLPYKYPSKVANEVDRTLRTFHSLRPQCTIYNLPDGSRNSLLNLIGNIPVISQQNQNRIIEVPIEICLPIHYPNENPIIWVRPELLGNCVPAVIVRITDNCDGSGLIRGIQLGFDTGLVEIIKYLQVIFGNQLPIVTSKVSIESNNNLSNSKTISVAGYNENSSDPLIYNNNNNNNNTFNNNNNNDNSKSKYEILIRKIDENLQLKMKKASDNLDEVLEMNSKLSEGKNLLNREKMVLNNEINLINKEIEYLDKKKDNLEGILVDGKSRISDRSATVPDDPISSQLVELLSNETALMDTLYFLIKITVTPIDKSETRLPLATALRCIRELSRKHFLTKAHIRKIINK